MLLTARILFKRPKPSFLSSTQFVTKCIAMCWRDEWPSGPDGDLYDGKQLMELVRSDNSPFRRVWDVKLLIQEIEEKLNTQVIDIPIVDKGSNNFGFHLKTSNKSDIVARLARGDVNMPDFEGFPIEQQVPEALFEGAIYELLRSEPAIRASRLLYYRTPMRHPGPRLAVPLDLSGRRLFVFERAEGVNNVWEDLGANSKLALLDQLACMRAALFNFKLPLDFAVKFLHERIFNFKPQSFAVPVAPTWEFWIHVLESKIKATIRDEGDMIGWEDDKETVGPIALAAKQSLLRAVPHIMPTKASEVSLCRLVLEHGDFGIHNTSIATDANGEPLVTSLYDWETACIVPAFLSDPLVAAGPVDLIVGEHGEPCVTRIPKNPTPMDLEIYAVWAQYYIKKLYDKAPDYELAIKAAKDVRHLWFALRDWRGGNSEEFFGGLGAWAEKRMKELGVS